MQRGQDVLSAEPGDGGEKAPVEPAPEHGGGDEHGARVLAQCGEAPPHAVGEGQWHDALDRLEQSPRFAVGDQRTRGHRHGQKLLHQERHAIGARRKVQDLCRHGAGVETRADHLGHLLLAETGHLDEHRDTPGLKGPCQLQPGGTVFVSRGDQAQDAFADQVVDEVLDDPERLRVGPVHILQHDEASSVRGHDPQEPQHCLGEGDDGVLDPWIVPPPLGNEQAEDGPEGLELRCVGGGTSAGGRTQRLGERPVGEGSSGRYRPSAEDAQAATFSVRRCGVCQPRLADPGLAHQEDHATLSAGGPLDRIAQGAGLQGPSDDAGREQ